MGISKTGYWDAETAHLHHAHSKPLASFLIEYLRNDKDKPLYDFGCGMGFYLSELHKAGFPNLTGFEGDVPKNKLYDNIRQQDLAEPFTVPLKGNCLCFEVMEHIPMQSSFTEKLKGIFGLNSYNGVSPNERALNNILNACDDKLILSWAVRGQPGHGHISCLNNEEVVERITAKGFIYFETDSMKARKVIDDNTPWFRNTLLIFHKKI